MMEMEELRFLYNHAKAYGGEDYALWIIAQYGKEDEIPGISHATQAERYTQETGSSSALEYRVEQSTTLYPAMTSKTYRNAFNRTFELRRE